MSAIAWLQQLIPLARRPCHFFSTLGTKEWPPQVILCRCLCRNLSFQPPVAERIKRFFS
jgi:hypothetical protein